MHKLKPLADGADGHPGDGWFFVAVPGMLQANF
jgi:hypothetical protein